MSKFTTIMLGGVGTLVKFGGALKGVWGALTQYNTPVKAGTLLTKELSTQFGRTAVGIGSVTSVLTALVAVIMTYNQQVVQTQKKGMEDNVNSWAKALADATPKVNDASDMVDIFSQKMDRMNKNWIAGGAVAATFVDRNELIKNGFKALTPALVGTTSSYEEYILALHAAADATTNHINSQGELVITSAKSSAILSDVTKDFGMLTAAEYASAKALADGGGEVDTWMINMRALRGELDETTAAFNEQQNQLRADTFKVIVDASAAYQEFTQTNRDLEEALRDATAEMEIAKATWGESSEAYVEAKENVDELTIAIEENATEWEMASKRIVFAMMQQQLAADGLDIKEFNALMHIGVGWGLLDKEVAAQATSIQGAMDGMDWTNPAEVYNLLNKIMGVPDYKRIGIDIDVNLRAKTGGFGAVSGSVNLKIPLWTGGVVKPGQQALVGDMPGGIPTDYSEIVEALPGGGFRVYNARETKTMLRGTAVRSMAGGSGGGGGMPVVLLYSPTFSTVDREELQDRLLPFIRDGLREVGING